MMSFVYYDDHTVLTAKTLPALLKQMPHQPEWNKPYIQAVLRDGFWMAPCWRLQTQFQSVYRIPYGYCLSDVSGGVKIIRQWQLDHPVIRPIKRLSEARNRLTDALLACVSRMSHHQNTGVELSGGLDSSLVSALLRQCHPKASIHAYTHDIPKVIPAWMYDAPFLCDETCWSGKVSEHLGLTQYKISQRYDLMQLLTRYSSYMAGFSEVLFPLLNHQVYMDAHQRGLTTLLSGFGGDEVLTGDARSYFRELQYKNQRIRYYYERLMARMTQVKSIPKQYQPHAHWRYLHANENDVAPSMAPKFTSVQGAEKAFVEGVLSLHWQRRIEAAKVVASFYNLSYEFPLADVGVMQLYHQLPSSFKRRHGYGRYLLRTIAQQYLPNAIAWRQDKAGATAPAAYATLLMQLPDCFLQLVDVNEAGVIAECVDIKLLYQLFESGPVLEPAIIRLALMVLMMVCYQRQR